MTYAQGPRELHSHGITGNSFEALAEIAIKCLQAQGSSGMVCGAISTGGTGFQIINLQIFNATIGALKQRGENVFNQIPYEYGLRRLSYEWEAKGNKGYCMPILEIFYGRLFDTGLITQGWFIPGWNSPKRPSIGTTWEREKLSGRSAVITDLSHDDIRRFLLQADPPHPPCHIEEVMTLLTV